MRIRRVSILLVVLIVGALFVFDSREGPAPLPRLDGEQLLLRVVALDAETGIPVTGVKWGLGTERWTNTEKLPPEIHAPVCLRDHAALTPPTGRESYGEVGWRQPPPYWERATVIVEPPSGYVAWDETDLDLTIVAPFAASLEYRYPLRREVVVALVVDKGATQSQRELVICALVMANKTRYYSGTELRARDGGLVQGVPAFRGETVCLLAASPGNWSSVAELVAQAGSHVHSQQQFHIPGAFWIEGTMSESPERRLQILLASSGVAGPCGFVHTSRDGEDGVTLYVDRGDHPFMEAIYHGPTQPRLGRGCQVRVRALRATGVPAVGASVSLSRERCIADGDGIALFVDVPPGPAELRLWGSGVLSTSDAVTVPAEENCLLTLTEREGGTLHIHVVDANGRGLPFARLDTGMHDVDLTGPARNIQRLDWFTDEQGRRTFHQVDPGPTDVRAYWGDRRGEADVAVRESAETSVRVVLR